MPTPISYEGLHDKLLARVYDCHLGLILIFADDSFAVVKAVHDGHDDEPYVIVVSPADAEKALAAHAAVDAGLISEEEWHQRYENSCKRDAEAIEVQERMQLARLKKKYEKE